MIEYQKTGGKEQGTNVYGVTKDGRKIGTLYREYYPAIGLGPRYVGHAPGSYEWKFDVEDWVYDSGLLRFAMYSFDSLKKAKEFIEDESNYEKIKK